MSGVAVIRTKIRLFTRAAILGLSIVLGGCQAGVDGDSGASVEAARAQLEAEFDSQGELERKKRFLGLAGAQAAALDAAYAQRDSEISAWIAGERGQRLIALEAKMGDASRGRDLQGVQAAIAEAKPLRQELILLIGEHEGNIRAVLSQEQVDAWDGYEIASELLALMEPLGLDVQQRSAIEQSGTAALLAARGRGESNAGAAAFLDLEKWAESSVLRAEQRAGYQEIKSQNKLRSLGI